MITLEHPFASPTTTLTLPNPRQGDADQMEIKVKTNYTMTGKPYIYSRPLVNEKLILQFNNLRDAHITAIRNFFSVLPNQDLKYTDYIGDVWKVRLVTDPIQFTRLRNCQWAATLELKGTPQ
jgi:hypothetical protein